MTDVSFGARLSAWRRLAGLSQGELAERSGLSTRAVSNLERGRTTWPHPDSVRRLADALGLRGEEQDEFIASAKRRLVGAAGAALSVIPAPLPAIGEAGNEAANAVRFGVLGPLQAVDDTGAVRVVSAAKQRIVLATLLLATGSTVSAASLAEALWDASPPPNAPAVMRTYVMRLRHTLGPIGARIVGHPSGLAVEFLRPEELDVAEADCLWRAARGAGEAGEWRQVSSLLSKALSLWRGEPLADVPSAALARRETGRLAELWLQLTEARIDADLRLGRHSEVVAELRRVAAEHPLREHIQAQLMLACYRCGHQAAALEVYRDARKILADELGVEPGRELREMQQRILTADPELTAGVPATVTIPSSEGDYQPQQEREDAVPRQLPAAVQPFTARAHELKRLTELADEARAKGNQAISVIAGMAGVGKTALAVQWAHQAAERFPDGQLYVNLRGYDPARPVEPGDALAAFLRALGVPGLDIPAELDERAARYRSLLAKRRMIVVLDNASSTEQVRPLLPGSATCVTIVTSRDSLPGLVARDGAWRLELDVLRTMQAVALLRALIGGRVDAEPNAAAELAGRCSCLPLALRVAAELAVAWPAESLASLSAELADLRRRLRLLDADGDPRGAVRAVFSWSYLLLHPDAARGFRVAGLEPGPVIDRFALAALTDTTPDQAGHVLGQLGRAHLIQPAAHGGYAMHDLLRAYARELAEAEDGTLGQQRALTRLFDYYLAAALAAIDVLYPAESYRRARLPAPVCPTPPVTNQGEAREWLDAGLANLVAAIAHTADHGWPRHAVRLAGTIYRFLQETGRCAEMVTVYTCSLRAARHAGDRPGEAEALNNLAVLDLRQSRYQHAAERLQQALALYEEASDHVGHVRVLSNLGIALFQQGCYQEAARYHQRAREQYEEIGDRAGEARALNNLGITQMRLGRYQQAADGFRYALTLHPVSDTEGYCLANLGLASLRLGRYDDAVHNLSRALILSRRTGNLACEAYCLVNLGIAEMRQDRFRQAAGYLRQAMVLGRKQGDQSAEADALNGLGEVSLATSRPRPARTQHARALGLATQIGDRYEQARAHLGLGRAYQAEGVPVAARRHWEEALATYADMGVPDADEVRAFLAVTGEVRPPQETDRETAGPLGMKT